MTRTDSDEMERSVLSGGSANEKSPLVEEFPMWKSKMPTDPPQMWRFACAIPSPFLNVIRLASLPVLAISAACWWPSIMPKATHTLECNEDNIETNHAGPIRIATGCGKKDVIIQDPEKDEWLSLRERAAFDLTCGNKALDVTELDSTTFGVSGCEKKAIYKFVPTSGFVRDAKTHLQPADQDRDGTEKGPAVDQGGTGKQPAPGSSVLTEPGLAEPTPPLPQSAKSGAIPAPSQAPINR